MGKDYEYFCIIFDFAYENLTGLEVAISRELIEKYIFPLWRSVRKLDNQQNSGFPSQKNPPA
jgi:hypothetical protein